MGKIVKRNQPCLDPVCGSSDGRQIYEDGTSFCFVCTTFFKAGEEFEVAEMEEPTQKSYTPSLTVEKIKELPVRGFADRKIEKSVTGFFRVRVAYDSEGSISAHYYPYESETAYKVRTLPKKFKWVGNSKALFGQDLFASGGKRLVITEGEIDAMSVAQASFTKYNRIYPVVAMSSSVMTESLLLHRDWIRSFAEVVLCLDNDKAGQEATTEAIRIVGVDKVRLTKLSHKDANEVLVQSGADALMACIFNAAPYIPSGIITKEALWEALVSYNSASSHPYPSCLEGINTKLKGKRGGEIALFVSGTGCFAKGTEILKADGRIAFVEDIVVGDVLVDANGKPTVVKTLFRGREEMVDITLRDGTGFTCNMSHVLTVVNNDSEGRWGLKKDQLVDVTVRDYILWSDKRKHLSKAFKSGAIEFQKKALLVDPYVLGVWLGDGYSDGGRFSCQDSDLVILEAVASKGYQLIKAATPFAWNAPGRLRAELSQLGLVNNKHIPEDYLTSDIEDRLQLLAGLLDTDGSYCTDRGGFEFSQKSPEIVISVKRLAESLGYACSVGKQKNNKFGNCFRLYISGDGIEKIPCRLPRKQARARQQIKKSNRYAFDVESRGEGDFFGFEVGGDGRFVLGNFIVTHNSGKSTMLREIELHVLETTTEPKIGIMHLEESPAETARKLAGMAVNKNPAAEEIPIEELQVGFEKVFGSDRVITLDHQGSLSDSSLIDKLEYMALSGCEYLFIDHITIMISEGVGDLTGNEAQDKVMNDLLRLVKRYPKVWIGLVSHLRKTPGQGRSFEEGKLPSMDDIRGSGSTKQIAFDIISFARNLTGDSEEERNTIKVRILKSRYSGLTGMVPGAIYDYPTGRLKPVDTFEDVDDIC